VEWDEFKHFLAVARTGSLSAAGRKLKASAATVGRRVAALERSLGARLFDRKQNGYQLTENGEAVLARAQELEETLLSVEREVTGRDLRASGKVRVATAEDIATFVIAPKLASFRRAYPGIVLEITASWEVANLTRREADVALRTARPTGRDYVIRRAGVWNCALYASKAYAKARNLRPSLHVFANLEVIQWTDEGAFRGGRGADEFVRNATVVFAANSRHIQYAACKAGIGAAVLPCVVADRDRDLIRLIPPEQVRSLDLWLVVHRDLARTARVRAVMDFLCETTPH
jgi:DNA-binding transcriptional LysR family regulator